MSRETTLTVSGLTKKIGKREIIKGIDFALKSGEVFGCLGPNGAGKTTTIRMLVGLIKPTSGSIRICGFDIRKQFTEAMRHIGCIVENPELYPYLSGWGNLKYFSRMLPDADDARIMEVVTPVRLEERIHDRVKSYSLGMRQRLGIAQALLGRPKVLILDEPTNGLDPSGIREMRQIIRFLAENEGLSVLVSSHLLSEIQMMCDRVAIILNSKVVHTQAVHDLLVQQERIVWRFQPLQEGVQLLKKWTDRVKVEEETVETPYIENEVENEVAEWSKKLVEAGINLKEMNRKIPSLEDLFLQITEGESGD
ncbi:ABC transporter ATP-binding protein [Bacillaceae bacterium Marseille-Q3522]|nr:ABC transporter ATP-binding protein [Bacillaceae bacterium Marseille-Q3522]